MRTIAMLAVMALRLLWARHDGLWASEDVGDTWGLLTASFIQSQFFLPLVLR
jgi:hypothetical protein